MKALLFSLVAWLMASRAYAEYASLVPTADLALVAGDTQTLAVWVVGVFVTIAGLGILIAIMKR